MSILIKGMEMPTRCGRCDLRIPVFDDGIFDHYECCITAAVIDNIGEKMEDCPLVPVPPHGRLGDLDELYAHLTEWYLQNKSGLYPTEAMYIRAMLAGIEDAPTIIQAEEGET